jgi:hypothetical protein
LKDKRVRKQKKSRCKKGMEGVGECVTLYFAMGERVEA